MLVKCLLGSPPQPKSGCCGLYVNAEISAKFANTATNAVDSESPRLSCVVHLFKSCVPSAVTWLVRFIIVQPFNRGAWRFLSHVSQKTLKGFNPPFAYSNTTPSVVLPRYGFGVGASLDHGVVRPVSRAALAINAMSVCRYEFSVSATAGCGVSTKNAPSLNCLCATAITKAERFIAWKMFEYLELSKSFSE